MREVQEHARVALHRAADIAQQHQRPWLRATPTRRQRDDFAAGSQAAHQCPTKIDARAAAADPAARAAFARNPLESLERHSRARHFLRRELGEVLVSQTADIAPGLNDRPPAASSLLPSADGPSSGGSRPAAAKPARAAVRASRTRSALQRERIRVVAPEGVEDLGRKTASCS